MSLDIALVLGIVLVAIVLFASDSIPIEVTSLTVVALLALTQVLTPAQAFHGFSNETVIFVFSLLAMTEGLVSTGVMRGAGAWLLAITRFGERAFLLAMMILVAGFSAFVSNTVTTAAFLPVALRAARASGIPRSRILMPLAFSSVLGGMVFLFGTSTNLVVSARLVELGMPGIGLAELTPAGLPIAFLGIAFVVGVGPRLLARTRPPKDPGARGAREYVTEVFLPTRSKLVGRPLDYVARRLVPRVLAVRRGDHILHPTPTLAVHAGDHLVVWGKSEEIFRLSHRPDLSIPEDLGVVSPGGRDEDLLLVEAIVPPESPLAGESLEGALFSERYGLAVLALHRHPAVPLAHDLGMVPLAGLPLGIGDVLLLVGPRDRLDELADGQILLLLSAGEPASQPRFARAPLALAIFLAALVSGSAGLVPLAVAGVAGMLAMIATRCLNPRLAFRVDWRVVLLIGSMMALGMAMDESGAGQALGGLVIEVAGAGGPGAILGLLMVLTVALSIPMSNQAAALVVLPIGLAAAANLGLSPRPFAIGITLAASCSLLTPLEPSAMMVFRPGNYRFADFLRVGGPLTAVLLLGLALLVPELWPFHDDDTGPITRAVLGSLPGKPPP